MPFCGLGVPAFPFEPDNTQAFDDVRQRCRPSRCRKQTDGFLQSTHLTTLLELAGILLRSSNTKWDSSAEREMKPKKHGHSVRSMTRGTFSRRAPRRQLARPRLRRWRWRSCWRGARSCWPRPRREPLTRARRRIALT